ncbi:Uncharacterised protein [Candidatus Venteria ishoeyi]|uniref:Uncharacterized protein n=1 Tax=Candidatus Venteria ishoeyi TaxID=1899563 RepID=A0A1H6F568_9GAMM|nr:Uncharacterised protein [Candidatus Venteria ishoeyi]
MIRDISPSLITLFFLISFLCFLIFFAFLKFLRLLSSLNDLLNLLNIVLLLKKLSLLIKYFQHEPLEYLHLDIVFYFSHFSDPLECIFLLYRRLW